MTSPEELMRHALGVQSYGAGRRWSKPYRNHFCADGDHVEIWNGLVAMGFATRREGNVITGNAPTFYVTDAGRQRAVDGISFKRRWGYGEPTHG